MTAVTEADERMPVQSLDMSSEPDPPRSPDAGASTAQLILLVQASCAAVVAAYVTTDSVVVSVTVAATALVTVTARRRG